MEDMKSGMIKDISIDCINYVIIENSIEASLSLKKNCLNNHLQSSSEADQVHIGKEAVNASISLTSWSHESSQSNSLLLASDLSVLINLYHTMTNHEWTYISNIDLNWGGVLRSYESVSGWTLSGNVEINNLLLLVLHFLLIRLFDLFNIITIVLFSTFYIYQFKSRAQTLL